MIGDKQKRRAYSKVTCNTNCLMDSTDMFRKDYYHA
jgi:hypothetical protein